MKEKNKKLVVFGAGGFAREIAWLVAQWSLKRDPYEILCFIVDDEHRTEDHINGIPVLSLEDAWEKHPRALAVAGVGNPKARREIAARLESVGFRFGSIMHPDAYWSEWNSLGEGSVIQAGSIITTNVTIGRHALINGNLSIGHDVVIGDYCTISPGVNISGRVHVETGAFVGTGAVILEGSPENPLVIGEGAVVGAGACVTRSVGAGVTVVGIPAKPIQGKSK